MVKIDPGQAPVATAAIAPATPVLVSSGHVASVRRLRSQGRLPWTSEMRGRWFKEEVEYFNKTYALFQEGLLADVDAGQAFREFMGDLLACDTMRISKKFCGDARIGHLRFPRTPKRELSAEEFATLSEELKRAESQFLSARASIRPRKRQRAQSADPAVLLMRNASPQRMAASGAAKDPAAAKFRAGGAGFAPRSLSHGSLKHLDGASAGGRPKGAAASSADQDASGLLLGFLDSVHRTAVRSPPRAPALLGPLDGSAMRGKEVARSGAAPGDEVTSTEASAGGGTDLPWAERIHALFMDNPGPSYWKLLHKLGEEVEGSLTCTLGDVVEAVRAVFEEAQRRAEAAAGERGEKSSSAAQQGGGGREEKQALPQKDEAAQDEAARVEPDRKAAGEGAERAGEGGAESKELSQECAKAVQAVSMWYSAGLVPRDA